MWENGFRHITNNKHPIIKPADLKGMKLRAPKGKWRVKMFQAYGANPCPMAFSEVFVALQTGVMDGQENPLTQIYSRQVPGGAEVPVADRPRLHAGLPLVAARKWDKLPEDVRKVLEEAARRRRPIVYETARSKRRRAAGQAEGGGMQVNEADKDAFIAASKPIYEEFGKEVPGRQADRQGAWRSARRILIAAAVASTVDAPRRAAAGVSAKPLEEPCMSRATAPRLRAL